MRLFNDSLHWQKIRDGNPVALQLHRDHYSKYKYRDGRKTKLILGPGEKLLLLGIDDNSLFGWRKFIDDSGQTGVNCAVFINRNPKNLSSGLILQAESIAKIRWPDQSFYTYVDPKKIKSKKDPGYCFLCAGWVTAGYTKSGKLILRK